MTDYAVRCADCDKLYAPLEQEKAMEIATQHCESTEHSNVNAVPFSELFPLVGTFERRV